MCIDFGGSASIEVLEEVGKGIGRKRCWVHFGGKAFEKSARLGSQDFDQLTVRDTVALPLS